MGVEIHKMAIVENGAELDVGVSVGAFAVVQKGAIVGKDAIIESHSIIKASTRIGHCTEVGHFSVLGGLPQHLGFDPATNSFVKIGNNVTLWSGNHIGHHSSIKDNCFITSQVVISGGVEVSENCFIGVNSTIRDKVNIGSFSIIGAGSIILKNVEPFGLYVTKETERSKVPSNRIRGI